MYTNNILTFLYSPITPEQRSMDNAIILFSVKDKDLFGMSNQYIAECYIAFKNISSGGSSSEQTHLVLSRPTKTGEIKLFFFFVCLILHLHLYFFFCRN